ncbi:MAG: DNA-processing protein DprA [Rubrivivax sp.]|nr:DNA-processing protein DprA [Rubrivivax sp.]MDP3613826.1 DNA-processing protein DprA [Rubrivivax sp.]
MLSAEEFAAWFRLLETPTVGRSTARRLLAACGSPQAIFATGFDGLRAIAGTAAAQALGQLPPGDHALRLAAAQTWLAGGSDRHVLTPGDSNYPPLLLQTADPPLLLYVQGSLSCLQQRALAIVGSRHATAQGLANARAFGAALSQQGLLVVSGLAQGIDAAAHEGALSGAAGTVAVVGTGLDRVYPPAHRALAQRIAAQGALLSEYAPGTPALPEHFPQRNRIIAGLSLGTLVVEAAVQSGSLITARLASEAGREVFAIPGSIHAPQAKGCHALLKQGAKLVETAQDILEELSPGSGRQVGLPLEPASDEASDPLIEALGHDPVTLDALIARTGCPAPELMARLMTLELDGRVARLPGGLYQRLHMG